MTKLPISESLRLKIASCETYFKGLPIMLEVTVENCDPEVTYYTLPEIAWFKTPPPLAITLTDDLSNTFELPFSLGGPREGPPKGFMLEPFQEKTMLFDLSILMEEVPDAVYTVHITYLARREKTQDLSFRINLQDVNSEEKLELAKLLQGEDWNEFLLGQARTIKKDMLKNLSTAKQNHLDFHLFVHYAIYGPKGIAELDINPLVNLRLEPLKSIARVFQHEISIAKNDPNVQQLAEEILTEKPGLAWRIEENLRKRGQLNSLRTLVGAERKGFALPNPAPYTEEDDG